VTATVLIADRITKYLVYIFIPLGDAVPGRDSFVKLLHTLNDGVAFSMLQGHRAPLIVLQSALVAVIVAIMFIAYRRVKGARRPLTVMTAFSLMLGGGLGNLWDRISTGFVTDFVSIGRFAVFNAADACLVAGCGLLVLYMLLYSNSVETGRVPKTEHGDDGAGNGRVPKTNHDGSGAGNGRVIRTDDDDSGAPGTGDDDAL
jgi:signal peptidase II